MKGHQNQRAWLESVLPQHERLAATVKSLLENVLKQQSIEYLSVESRVKTVESAIEKIERKEYNNPKAQLTDLAGIRVITYLEQQVTKISDVVKQLFEIDEENSLDRTQILGDDKVGYRSTHFVCTLGSDRGSLPENKELGNLKFEIQLRTVLQHAWAELAHDRTFKFKASLPTKIERKLNLYSGMLELIDGAFNDISSEIDTYSASLKKKSLKQLASAGIDSLSIERFVTQSAAANKIELRSFEADQPTITLIKKVGIKSIGELESLLDHKFVRAYRAHIKNRFGLIGFVRLLLMYHDLDRTMKFGTWGWIPEAVADFLVEKYGRAKVDKVVKDCDLTIEEETPRRLAVKGRARRSSKPRTKKATQVQPEAP